MLRTHQHPLAEKCTEECQAKDPRVIGDLVNPIARVKEFDVEIKRPRRTGRTTELMERWWFCERGENICNCLLVLGIRKERTIKKELLLAECNMCEIFVCNAMNVNRFQIKMREFEEMGRTVNLFVDDYDRAIDFKLFIENDQVRSRFGTLVKVSLM